MFLNLAEPSSYLEGEKVKYTIYLPKKLSEQMESSLKVKNEQILKRGDLNTVSRSSFIEEILLDWLFSHTNLLGLDSPVELGYNEEDKEKITINISSKLLALVKYICLQFDESPSVLFTNAIDWYLSVHWGHF